MPRESIEVLRMRGVKEEFGEQRGTAFGKAAAAAPFTIRSLGLGSGVATLAAGSGDENKKIAAMIARWLIRDGHWTLPETTLPGTDSNDNDDAWISALMVGIAKSSRAEYRIAQIEAMGYAIWIKKLAKAFCREEES